MKLSSFVKGPLVVKKTGDDSAASSLLKYVWRMTGWHQVIACAGAVVVTLLNLVPLELQRRIVNEVVEGQNIQLLVQFGLIYGTVILLHQTAKFALRVYQGWMTESTTLTTRKHLLKLYDKSVDEDDNDSGRAVSIVGGEVEKLGGFVGEALSQAVSNVATLLGVAAYMFVIEPAIAFFAFAVLLPQVLLTPVIQRRLNDLVETRIGLMRDMGDKIADMDADTRSRNLAVVPEIYENRMEFIILKFAMKSILNLLNALGPISVLFFGGYMVMTGETQVGVIVAFLSGFDRLASPVRELIGFYRVAAQANVQHRLVAKWMHER